MILELTIMGDPTAKGRGRMVTHDRQGRPLAHGRIVTPTKTRKWQEMAGGLLLAEYYRTHGLVRPVDRPCVLDVVAIKARPQAMCRAKDPDGRLPAPVKPDWDNVGKIVSDALDKGGVLTDDKIICRGTTTTLYGDKGEAPCVQIRLSEWTWAWQS